MRANFFCHFDRELYFDQFILFGFALFPQPNTIVIEGNYLKISHIKDISLFDLVFSFKFLWLMRTLDILTLRGLVSAKNIWNKFWFYLLFLWWSLISLLLLGLIRLTFNVWLRYSYYCSHNEGEFLKFIASWLFVVIGDRGS